VIDQATSHRQLRDVGIAEDLQPRLWKLLSERSEYGESQDEITDRPATNYQDFIVSSQKVSRTIRRTDLENR